MAGLLRQFDSDFGQCVRSVLSVSVLSVEGDDFGLCSDGLLLFLVVLRGVYFVRLVGSGHARHCGLCGCGRLDCQSKWHETARATAGVVGGSFSGGKKGEGRGVGGATIRAGGSNLRDSTGAVRCRCRRRRGCVCAYHHHSNITAVAAVVVLCGGGDTQQWRGSAQQCLCLCSSCCYCFCMLPTCRHFFLPACRRLSLPAPSGAEFLPPPLLLPPLLLLLLLLLPFL